jgi:tyrosine-protein kinase
VTVARPDHTNGSAPTAPPPAWTPRQAREGGAGPYLRAVRTHWLLIVEVVLAAVVAAGVYATVAPKRYQAEADLVVTPIAADDPAYVGVNVLRDSVQGSSVVTAATLATTPPVVRSAAARAHVAEPAAGGAVSASPLIQSSVVAVSAQASSPALARRLANAFAAAVVAERGAEYRASIHAVQAELAAQLRALPAGGQNAAEATAIGQHLAELAALPPSDPSIRILSPAALPSSPAWPRRTLIVGAAFAVALILGVGLALAREFLTQRLTGEDELVLEQGLPVLARVPRMRRVDAEGYLTRRRPLPPEVWESYRTLRVLVHGAGRRSPRTILITSAVAGEGKTMTAVNLAATMAQAGERVVLVDADLRRPMIASVFGAPADAPDPFRVAGFGDRLSLVTGLPDEVLPEGVADAAALRRWFAGLLRRADVVVVDSAPVTAVADALELVSAVDTVLLAVRIGLSRRDRLDDARQILSLRGVTPAGVVLTTRARGQEYGEEVRRAAPADALAPVGGNRYGAVPVATIANGHREPAG